MRLWHKDLIPVLPRQQLIAQWRECCCIARNITINGTPNHLLVNKVLDYPPEQFNTYAHLIYCQMFERGYKCDWFKFSKYRENAQVSDYRKPIFTGWHNDRYLTQCYYNLQEKYDCGGITDEEWVKIDQMYKTIRYTKLWE